jgi:hypothetical protein
VQYARGSDFALAEYEYRRRALGGDDYLSTHRLYAFVQKAFGRALLDGSYGVEHRGYQQQTADGFSGWWQQGTLEGGYQGGSLALLLGYALARDAAEDAALASVEHGPLLEVRLHPDADWRVDAALGLSFRGFDAENPDARSDTRWSAGATAALDLGLHWTALLALRAERNESSVDAFRYSALSATLGVQFTLGVSP